MHQVEQIIVYLKGVIPNQLFQLRDPKCKLKPIDRDTQAIKVSYTLDQYDLTHYAESVSTDTMDYTTA